MKSLWREKSVEVITKIIKENPKCTEKELKGFIREAYPFGERKYHPYKIWLDSQKRLLAVRKYFIQ